MFPLSLFLLSLLPAALAVGTPFGQATGTTGGGSASEATPSSLAELTAWLSDSTARTIVLTSVFDFTASEGTTTGKICKPWTCSPNPQVAIDQDSWCEKYESGAETRTATYDNAALKPLTVGSNKTLLGKGSNAGIKGKGLKITGASNIIIQNTYPHKYVHRDVLHFSCHQHELTADINEQYVWGGDALQIDGGSKIWVDHNYFERIGRQMVVTGYGAVTQTTFSNNVFNGEGTYSSTCNGCHYWAVFFTGNGDIITFALNHMYKTSGRGPKRFQGTSGYYQNVHIYNNVRYSVAGHAINPVTGSKALVEGNSFNTVTTPVKSETGEFYFPQTSEEASACSSSLGRSCVTNTLLSSGSVSGAVTNAIEGFADVRPYPQGIAPMSASDASAYVQANAGVGIVN
ncbi:pectin lyase-like protein [Hymenopellis radicata]|nr:pectin lyase-like protein [Hymenopellis radicata]